MAFQGIGGVQSLQEWAQDNQTEFYKIWSRLLPLEVTGEGGDPIKMVIVTGVPDQVSPSQEHA